MNGVQALRIFVLINDGDRNDIHVHGDRETAKSCVVWACGSVS